METNRSTMANDIIDVLEDLGYTGPLVDIKQLESTLDSSTAACSKDFTELVAWVATDLARTANLDETVTSISSPDDEETFLVELSGFLRECNCPYSSLTAGPIGERFASKSNRFLLINYLVTELQAARIVAAAANGALADNIEKLEIVSQRTSKQDEAANLLKQTMIALGIPKPPDDITATLLFERFGSRISELTSSAPDGHLGKPLMSVAESSAMLDAQWETVEVIARTLAEDYECRRQMLLQRLSVTIESFTWSDRLQRNDDRLVAAYHPIRQRMRAAVMQADAAHVLAARDDLMCIERTSSGTARQRTVCDVNRVVMGAVPDRGGRAYEHGPPAPEMPSFRQRHSGGGHRGGGGPRGGGGDQRKHGGGWRQGNKRGHDGGGDFWQSKRGLHY